MVETTDNTSQDSPKLIHLRGITEDKREPEDYLPVELKVYSLESDPWVFRIVTIGFLLLIIGTAIAVAFFAYMDKEAPALLMPLASVAIGALAGIFGNRSSSEQS